VDGLCKACLTTANCGLNQYCNGNKKCKDQVPVGVPCSANQQCLSGDCSDPLPGTNLRFCLCVANADCTGDLQYCAGDGGCAECLKDSQCTGSGGEQYCTSDNSCALKLPLGAPCGEDAGCQSGACLVTTIGICVECESNSQCDTTTEYCSNTSCVSKLPVGAPCGGDASCESAFCEAIFTGNPVKVCKCTADEQCPGADLCVDGACDACGLDTDCQAGEYCSDSNTCVAKMPVGGPCSSGDTCLSGNCKLLVGQLLKTCTCSVNSDCTDPSKPLCKNDDTICVECKTATDCDTGDYCTSDKTCAAKQPVGGLCSKNAGCLSGDCTQQPGTNISFCHCASDSDCAGEVCDTSSGACEECTGDGDCGNGEYCSTTSQECNPKKPLGVPCGVDDSSCLSGHCAGALLSVCVECESDGHCGNDEYCSSNSCAGQKVVGLPCGDDDECTSGSCEALFAGGVKLCQCTNDGQCPNVCDENTGFCEECLVNSHCDTGEFCSSSDECEAKLSVGQPGCSVNSDCLSNNCEQIIAGVALNHCVCTSDSQCESDPKTEDECKESTGSCVECTSSTHCSNTQYCKSNDCIAKLPDGVPCSTNTSCLSGKCEDFLPGIGPKVCK
jgi:hypothetical protein